MGAGGLPLWLPRPEYDGMMTHAFEPSRAGGLTRAAGRRHRPRHPRLAAGEPRAPRTGMSREREADLLDRWSRKAR